jgi:hypothetical protein
LSVIILIINLVAVCLEGEKEEEEEKEEETLAVLFVVFHQCGWLTIASSTLFLLLIVFCHFCKRLAFGCNSINH